MAYVAWTWPMSDILNILNMAYTEVVLNMAYTEHGLYWTSDIPEHGLYIIIIIIIMFMLIIIVVITIISSSSSSSSRIIITEAGLNMAYVACGRLDGGLEEGSWEASTGPKIWDFDIYILQFMIYHIIAYRRTSRPGSWWSRRRAAWRATGIVTMCCMIGFNAYLSLSLSLSLSYYYY